MDKYGEMDDSIYCYPDSDVLKNKLNIQDAEILQQAELELTEYASTRIEDAGAPYGLKYLQSIHFQLFSDLYAWAGELRQWILPKAIPAFVPSRVLKLKPISSSSNLSSRTIFKV